MEFVGLWHHATCTVTKKFIMWMTAGFLTLSMLLVLPKQMIEMFRIFTAHFSNIAGELAAHLAQSLLFDDDLPHPV